jgi:hypothetical protein
MSDMKIPKGKIGIAKSIADMAKELMQKKAAVLPKEEAEANLRRMLDQSKVQQRLYHGTTATEGGKGDEAIRRIKSSKEGALGSGSYLTPQPDRANLYTRSSRPDAGGNVLPVYAQIKNPLILDGPSNRDPMIEALTKLGMDEQKASRMVERAYENKGYIGKEVESRARAAGYDGLMQYRDGELAEVVSYNPNAIKSAIGNVGTYDTSVPELSKAHGGAVRKAEGGAATSNEAMLRRSRRTSKYSRDVDWLDAETLPEEQPPAEMRAYEPTTRQRLGESAERALRKVSPAPRARAIADLLTGGREGAMLSAADFVPFLGTGMAVEEIAPHVTGALSKGNIGEAALYGGLGIAAAIPGIPGTLKAAKAAGKAIAPKAGELAEQYMMRTGMALPIIKEGGGNWMAGDVERGLSGLKQNNRLNSTKNPQEAMVEIRTTYPPEVLSRMSPETQQEVKAIIKELEYKIFLNQFVDKQIANYVKNQMGTKDDPIRLAADAWPAQKAKLLAEKQVQIDKATADMEKARQSRGFTPEMMTRSQARIRALEKERELIERRVGLHYEPGSAAVASYKARQQAGFPVDPVSTTPYGQAWENISDVAIEGAPYRMRLPMVTPETAPDALRELGGEFAVKNPNAMAYSIKGGNLNDVVLGRNLGFDHMMDEMRNATNIESGLPKELLIDPKNLSKWTMPQVTEHVDKINAWRASQKAEADLVRANNAATVLHKDYPEKGMRWVELKTPEATLPEGATWEEYAGNQRLFGPSGESLSMGATKEEAMRLLNRQEREGTLADALKYEGEQLQHCVGGYCDDVTSGRSRIFSLRDAKGNPHATVEVKPSQTLTPEKRESQIGFLVQRLLGEGMSEENALRQAAKLYPKSETMQSIAQIKGKGNAAPSEEYLPYVQDFVRSGEWNKVGDLKNTGLMKKSDYIDEFTPSQLDSIGSGEYVTKQELDSLRLPPEGGMKRGGKVRKPISLDAMRLAVGGMAEGGIKLTRAGIARRSIEEAKRLYEIAKKDRSKEAQFTAGLYHPIGGGVKLSRPTELMTANIVEDPSVKVAPRKIITLEDLQGGVAIPLVGDRAAAGRILQEVEGQRLKTPVNLQGGPGFMQTHTFEGQPEKSAAWASGQGIISRLSGLARDAAEKSGTDKVFAPYISMSPTGVDFNTMVSNAVLGQYDPAALTKKAKKEFLRDVRNYVPDTKKPHIKPGSVLTEADLNDVDALRAKMLSPDAGPLRKVFVGRMGAKKFQDQGFPNIAATRKAVTEPELLHEDVGSTGYNIARIDPEGRIVESPLIPHETYPVQLRGEYFGSLEQPISYREFFPGFTESQRLSGKPEAYDWYTFGKQLPIQTLDQEWLDSIMKGTMKPREWKAGGVVKKAGGGILKSLNAMRAFVEAGKKAKLAEKSREAAAKGEVYIPDEEAKKAMREALQPGMPDKPEGFADGGAATVNEAMLRRERRLGKVDRPVSISPKQLARGWAAGTIGLPGDIESLGRAFIPGVSDETFLPTSEQMLKKIPGAADDEVGQRAAQVGTLFGGAGAGRIANAIRYLPTDVMRAAMDAYGPQATASHVIKPKGGNWLAGGVEDRLKGLKRFSAINFGGGRTNENEVSALNNWIDKQLTRYVKNDMGTPEDPIRALAEKGNIHFNPTAVNDPSPSNLMAKRVGAGMPAKGMGQSEAAKNWEDITDRSIKPASAGSYVHGSLDEDIVAQNPWLKKVDPEAEVYYATGLPRDVHFDHLVDELKNAINPRSGLPKELQLRPESLDRLSVQQAVERVAKINEWRAAQKAEADLVRANNPATVTFKEYPEGYRWAELKTPEYTVDTLPKRYSIRERENNQGGKYYSVRDTEDRGWEIGGGMTPEKAIKNSGKRIESNYLEDALKYEGEQMGHCVGGYCPDVEEGRSRIYSLRDAKGQPHVTIEVAPKSFEEMWSNLSKDEQAIVHSKASSWASDEELKDISKNYFSDKFKDVNNIVQIKGKGNKKPADKYLPFVQDFVRSGEWSDIGDFQNTGLVRIDTESDLAAKIKAAGAEAQNYVTQDELTNLLKQYGDPNNMKNGGRVKSAPSLDAMRLATLNKQRKRKYG